MVKQTFKIILLLSLTTVWLNGAVNLSNTTAPSLYPQIAVDNLNQIHVVWVEMNNGNRGDVYYIMYTGTTWTTPMRLSTSRNVRMDDNTYLNLDIECDPQNRVYVVWNETSRIYMRTKSGNTWGSRGLVTSTPVLSDGVRLSVYDASKLAVCWWNTGGSYSKARINGSWEASRKVSEGNRRAKFPDIAVGRNTMYMNWVKKGSSGNYDTMWASRSTSYNARWSGEKRLYNDGGSHSFPRMTIAASGTPYASHLSFFNERKYFVVTSKSGSNFGSATRLTGLSIIHFPVMYNRGNTIYALWQMGSYEHGSGVYFSVLTEKGWSSYSRVEDSNGAKTGDIAAQTDNSVIYAVWDEYGEIYLAAIGGDAQPAPIPNKPPRARFTFSPTEGLYPLSVHFNASASSDPDGKIVSYKWDFGDGTKGSGKTISHTYSTKGDYSIELIVQDDDGDTDSATGGVAVLGIQGPINVKYEMLENKSLFFTEYIYKLTWQKNPINPSWGSEVVQYKIYRKRSGDLNYAYFTSVKAKPWEDAAYAKPIIHEYFDRTLGSTNIQYQYTLVSVDSMGRESELETFNEEDSTVGEPFTKKTKVIRKK